MPRNNKINVNSIGTRNFLRYIVVNGNEFWNGSTWVADRKSAMLFATFRDASTVWRTLRESEMGRMPQQLFEARVVLTVCSNGHPIDVDELCEFLANNLRLVVDLDEEPAKFQVDVEIDWNTLTPAPQANLDPRTLAKSVYNQLKKQLGCDPGSVDAALDPNRMRLLDWNERPACKQIWITAVARAVQQMRSEQ